MENKTVILKTLVGSRAHGLNTEDADYDYRGVYILPTTKVLSIGYKYKGSSFIEGEIDNTSYELGHFLHLALKCNPSILEVFKAPIVESNELGKELIELFPYIWNKEDAFNAFVGYGSNQRKKMLSHEHMESGRWQKYAVAYLRTVFNLCQLFAKGTFSLEVTNENFKGKLLTLKEKDTAWRPGEIIDMAEEFIQTARELKEDVVQVPDPQKVNKFLLNARQLYWGDNENSEAG